MLLNMLHSSTFACLDRPVFSLTVPASVDDIIPNNLRLTVGQTAVFKCITSGDPAPTVHWSRQMEESDGSISLVEDDRLYIDGGVLSIQNVTLDDEGFYVCAASNKVGKTHRHHIAVLDVLGEF